MQERKIGYVKHLSYIFDHVWDKALYTQYLTRPCQSAVTLITCRGMYRKYCEYGLVYRYKCVGYVCVGECVNE